MGSLNCLSSGEHVRILSAFGNLRPKEQLSGNPRQVHRDYLTIGRKDAPIGHGKRLCIKCEAAGDGGAAPESSAFNELLKQMDRRQFFLASSIGLSSLMAGGATQQQAAANPVQLGNITACKQAVLPQGAAPVNCCPPPNVSSIIDFQFDTSLPMRTRRPAHLVDSAYIAQYNRAYELLRALPDDDPRKFSQQANVHCAYCNGSFMQADDSNNSLQIHNNWLFLPWHRWYLYFHERILASLLGDDSFALPYWNWDNQDASSQPLANVIPAMYINSPALVDNLREPSHLAPRLVDLNYAGEESSTTTIDDTQQRAENNTLMYQQVVSGARTPTLFMGLPYRAGDADAPGSGTLENAPHGPVHVWTGSSSQPNFEDMGTLYAAARDPIFFAHHANVDRIWTVWKSLGGRRRDFTDADWLNAEFLFYDENAALVRVKVADALSPEKLRFEYEDIGNAWVSARPSLLARVKDLVSTTATSPTTVVSGIGGAPPPAVAGVFAHIADDIEDFGEAVAGKFKKLEGVFRSRVKRPLKGEMEKFKRKLEGDDEVEEVLVIQGLEIDCTKATKFDVFINLPGANEKTPTNVIEYAGTFVNVPHLGMGHGTTREATFRIGIGDKLEQLGITDVDDLVVTLVPKGVGKTSPVTFKGIKIEYD